MSQVITVNGTEHEVPNSCRPDLPLAEFLREIIGLKGTKVMCREGGCGACMVAVERPQSEGGKGGVMAIQACLAPVSSLTGCRVTTTEGLGSSRDGFHPIQQRLIDHHGSQCGYCSPGMVMSMYSLLKSDGHPSEKQVEKAFTGNLCRCTGYRPIMEAMKSFSADGQDAGVLDIEDLDAKICSRTGKPCTSDHPVTPPEKAKRLEAANVTWYRPTSLEELHQMVDTINGGESRLVFGNTVSAFFKPVDVYVDLRDIKSLYSVKVTDTHIELGANLTLTSMIEQFHHFGKQSPDFAYLSNHLAPHFEKIASQPLRNAACWAGNLMLHHKLPGFPSDIVAGFRALGAQLVISKKEGQSVLDLDQFYRFDMKDKVIESVRLPKLADDEVFRVWKVMPRAANAHCYINGAFRFKLTTKESTTTVESSSIVFCGISKGCIIGHKTQEALAGKVLNNQTITGALQTLAAELQPKDTQLISATYKKNLAVNMMFKCLSGLAQGDAASVLRPVETPVGRGSQEYQTKEDKFPVTQASNRYTGEQQASGETQYIWDLPKVEGELQAALVQSTISKGRLDGIDVTEAMKAPGVVNVITAKDIPGKNDFGMGPQVLADDEIPYYGFPVAAVVADTEQNARQASRLVKVTYKDVERPITDIHEAIKLKRFHQCTLPAKVMGDAQGVMATCDNVIEGEISLGSQFHCYIENQVALCVPWEEGMRVWSATQWPKNCQAGVAGVLGIANNSVDVYTTKLGGAFGGKGEFSSMPATLCAIASNKVRRPVRIMFDMPTSMALTGHREAIVFKYKLGVNTTGEILAVDCTAYVDVGTEFPPRFWPPFLITTELMNEMDGAYYIPNWRIEPVLVKTDHVNMTFMRGPWDLGCAVIAEQFVEHAARVCGREPEDLKLQHMYQNENQEMLMGMTLPCVLKLRLVWDEVMSKSNFGARKVAVQQFNQVNKWVKRGLAATPVRFLILLSPLFNYPVFVSICAEDGSVILNHGGIEMGQGIHTKAAQVCARELAVSMDQVKIKLSSTIISPNAMATGGSRTSEIVCRGIIDACDVLKERIRPFREKNPDDDWKTLTAKCHGAGVDLASHNVHIVHNKSPATYATCGCAVSEVEVDVLTGESKVNRVDIVMDVGESLNPGVDIGQIEGAFIMGQGYMMTEREVFDRDSGKLLTSGTWDYKIPTNLDIPRELNVSLLKDSSNPAGVLPTRAIGEPPICLSVSVLHAIKDAVWSSRRERGVRDYFTLDVPATPEVIQRACAVGFDDLKLPNQ